MRLENLKADELVANRSDEIGVCAGKQVGEEKVSPTHPGRIHTRTHRHVAEDALSQDLHSCDRHLPALPTWVALSEARQAQVALLKLELQAKVASILIHDQI